MHIPASILAQRVIVSYNQLLCPQLFNQDGNQAQALGIQFNRIPPNLSGLLLVFADNLYHAD